MEITLLEGTIKKVALHSRVSHHLFERKDCERRELGTGHFHDIYLQRAEILLALKELHFQGCRVEVCNIDDMTNE